MSERYRAESNVNDSKNTRLPIREEFKNCRFNRDALAHISRYLFIVEQVIELAKKKKRPLNWLDIGCGDVYLARTLDKSFVIRKTDVVSHYVGFDIDDKRIAKTRKDMPGSMNIELICGDITTGDLQQFNTMSFDLITCLEVTEHIKPRFVLPFYKEIARIAPQAWISTPNFTGGTGKLPKDHIKEWDAHELMDVMKEAGLEVKQAIGIFSNLNHVRQYIKGETGPHMDASLVYRKLVDKFDSNFLSLIMGRMLGTHAQNVLYHVVSR